jgi:broad specificity phosphatase PhoE
MVRVRPGATDFDEQGRIKGILDLPLSESGTTEVAATVAQLANLAVDVVYTGPCRSAVQTAEAIAAPGKCRVKTIDELQNLDHGLWHGKLIDELRQCQPKVYRQWQDHPESICPPGGEALGDAQERLRGAIVRILRKHRSGTVAIVVPEPAASLVRCFLDDSELGNLWKVQNEHGGWQVIDIEPQKVMASA